MLALLTALRANSTIGRRFLSVAAADSSAHKKPAISQRVRFIDRLRVAAKGGHGGGGSSALFGRTGHHPRAAGGNGAAGGSVVLRATRQLTGLGSIPLHVEALRGGHGGKQCMDGRKGADQVVQVPLGTLVWRLLQLSGSADRPYGVTPQPAAAAAAAVTVAAGPGSRGPRKSLFPAGGAQVQADPADMEEDAAAAAAAAAAAVEHSAGEHGPTGAAGANLDDCSSSSACREGSESVDQLYQQLISCQQVLNNAQKLHLLHTGCLVSAAHLAHSQAAGAAGGLAELDADEDEAEEGESDDGAEHQEPHGNLWQQQQQQQQAGGEEEGEVPARHFSKAQVWSVLEAQAELLGELDQEGQQLLVARGGRGGRGNAAIARPRAGPASRQRTDGQPGEEVLLLLRLRLLADVVLVGLPNVGKSSLIAALTGARAQVGSYAFTTLRPQLGVVTDWSNTVGAADQRPSTPLPPAAAAAEPAPAPLAAAEAAADRAAADRSSGNSSSSSSRQLVIADLPGLVPGAHTGKGRGTAFLAHLERARVLALVLDMTGSQAAPAQQQHQQQQQDAGGRQAAAGVFQELASSAAVAALDAGEVLVPYTPEQQLAILQEEMAAYDARVLRLPLVVIANKLDLLSPEAAAAGLQRLKAVTALPILPVSAKQAIGLGRLKNALQLLVVKVAS